MVVSEKIDGANASLCCGDGKILAFSRRQQLTPENNLRGFYEFAQSLSYDELFAAIGSRYIIFGEWLCLSGDTVIKKASSGKALNTMTLREMYWHKHSLRKDVGCKRGIRRLLYLLYEEHENVNKSNFNSTFGLDKETTINAALQEGFIVEIKDRYYISSLGIEYLENYYYKNSSWGKDGFPSIYSLNLETDEIQTNRMADIVYSGEKEVFELTTHKGYKIKSTAEHKFLTPTGWKPLKELKEYDCVAITDFISRKSHGRTYGKGTRAIFKAQEEYKKEINKCEKCGNTTGLELHHIDENCMNNDRSNWMVLCRDCHKKIHTKSANQPSFDYEFDYIVNIESKGIEDCYDIAMTGGEDLANFIANNFIVHNCKHTVIYPENKFNQFYVFDVWDTEIEQYMPWAFTKEIADKLGLNTVPIFYDGEFISWDDIAKLVGKTEMGASPEGEGTVIKSQDRLDNRSSKTPPYVKIVSERFSEVQKSSKPKKVDPEVLAARQAAEKLAATIVTERRVEKLLEKMVDEGILPEDWDEHDMKTVSKNLPRLAYEDCCKEESETVAQIENFGKICGSLAMKHARALLK